MINALYAPFPDSITADGRTYGIITDFRDWLRFADMQEDGDIPDEEKTAALAAWLTEPPDCITEDIVGGLFGFYQARELVYAPPHEESGAGTAGMPSLFSWCIDAMYIIGDFRRYYGMDLRTIDYLHWWEFRLLFMALPDDSACQKRIGYRSVKPSDIRDNAERRRIQKIQSRIALPYEFGDDAIGEVLGGVI